MSTSKLYDLYQILRSLYDQKGSGRVSVLYQFNGGNSACTILINAGQFVNILPTMDLNGFHSANMHIKRVLLTASENMARHEISPNMPKMIGFLSEFQSSANARQNASALDIDQLSDVLRLKNQVNDVLASLIGKRSVAQINKISAKFSPARQPIQFLDECKGLIEITLNREIADEIFRPIYNNVRNTK